MVGAEGSEHTLTLAPREGFDQQWPDFNVASIDQKQQQRARRCVGLKLYFVKPPEMKPRATTAGHHMNTRYVF